MRTAVTPGKYPALRSNPVPIGRAEPIVSLQLVVGAEARPDGKWGCDKEIHKEIEMKIKKEVSPSSRVRRAYSAA